MPIVCMQAWFTSFAVVENYKASPAIIANATAAREPFPAFGTAAPVYAAGVNVPVGAEAVVLLPP